MEFITSNKARNRSWLLSFARRNDGDDIDVNNWSNFELAAALKFSI
jgi:hypothetical protein